MQVQDNEHDVSQLSLPPGFRFFPTDEELLVQYLCKKVAGHHFSMQIIGEIDLYKFDPWDLPSKAMFGEKEWYFFSPRDRKYPNGSRPNRVAGSGYWKATGTDKVVTTEGFVVGIKKALVFYVGKAPKGSKTNWIMHEYRLIDSSRKHSSSKLDEWVLCRIYKKKSASSLNPVSGSSRNEQSYVESTSPSSPSHLEDMLQSSPDIDEQFLTTLPRRNMNSVNLQSLGSGNFDWATLAGLNSAQAQSIMKTNVSCNDMYDLKPSNRADEEMRQSRLRIHRNSGEAFGFRYPTAPGGCVFRQ